MRYRVIFGEQGATPRHGSLALEDGTLVLGDELRVRVHELAAVRTSRSPKEHLNGHPALVLERPGSPPLLVSPLGAGALAELAELLAALAVETKATEHVAIVLPLKPESSATRRARQLIERGPPFELGELGGLRHSVHLGRGSVVFVFDGDGAREAVEQLMRRPGLWRAGVAWRECASGRPHVTTSPLVPGEGTELVFSWPAAP
jgi:hypothetical protein